MKQRSLYRLLDANFNRSREGLRVCEDIIRFYASDRLITLRLKRARHRITRCLGQMPIPYKEFISFRDTQADVGRNDSALENNKKDIQGLFLANIERSKESLRVLEEVSRLIGASAFSEFKKIRFYVYAIEKNAVPKLEALRHHSR